MINIIFMLRRKYDTDRLQIIQYATMRTEAMYDSIIQFQYCDISRRTLLYDVAKPSILKIIIIRLALVIHIYSKFETHIIIATSLVINYQRHNFLQSTELFLALFIIEIINKRRFY